MIYEYSVDYNFDEQVKSSFNKRLEDDFKQIFKYYKFQESKEYEFKVDFEKALASIRFSDLCNICTPRSSNIIKNYINPNDEKFIPDFYSAFLQAIMKGAGIKIGFVFNIWTAYLYYLETVMSRLPYQKEIENLDENVRKSEIVIAVAGCQDFDFLKRRVKKAASLTAQLLRNNPNQNIIIILSGRNNSPNKNTKVTVSNESSYMRNFFLKETVKEVNFLTQKLYKNIILEQKSTNTRQNIKFIFQQIENYGLKEVSLFIVSSTFHIYRIFKDLEKYIIENKLENIVKKSYLVGSEIPEKTLPIDNAYFKQLMLETFNNSITIK